MKQYRLKLSRKRVITGGRFVRPRRKMLVLMGDEKYKRKKRKKKEKKRKNKGKK